MTDGRGTPLAVVLTPGQRHESIAMASALEAVPVATAEVWPDALAGDKGSSYPKLRQWLAERSIRDVIPTRKDQARDEAFDRERYRRRSVIECCVGWLKEFRRVATRYEKLAVHDLAMLKLAMIRRYLKLQLSDTA